MKTALFLFFSILVLPCFSQSKKATNKILKEKYEQLIQQNDSIGRIIANNNQKLLELSKKSFSTSRNLFDRRQEFKGLKKDITDVQMLLVNLGFDPNTLVRQEDLDDVYGKYDEVDYQKEVKGIGSSLQPVGIKVMEDFSTEKLKVQNERLAQKNLEYIAVIDSNLQVIKKQEVLETKFTTTIQKMEAASVILIKNKKVLRANYELLRSKCSELELKKEELEMVAENAKKELVVKSSSKKKKEKTILFVPPEVIEKEKSGSDIGLGAPFDFRNMGESDPIPPPAPDILEKSMMNNSEIFEIVEEPASFPGGLEGLKKYLSAQVVYPARAKEDSISGKVYLKFIVSNTGQISNVKVMKGILNYPEFEAEAIRVIRLMPNWIPAKNNGKMVNSYFTLPIQFKL